MGFYKTVAILLLLFNGLSALWGGAALIYAPDGAIMHMAPAVYLSHSPFNSFLIPGIILFTCNGLFSIFTAIAGMRTYKAFPALLLAQGMILCGWIGVQILMIRTINPLHGVFGFTGLAMVLLSLPMCSHNKFQ